MSIYFYGKKIGSDSKTIQTVPQKFICSMCQIEQHVGCMTNKCECRCKND